jgi:hypothetical protein
MVADRRARAQQVAGDVERSVGAVDVLIVPERLRDAEPVERLAGDHAAAGTHVGRDVKVRVGEAEELAAPRLPPERPARGAHRGLGIATAAPRMPEDVEGTSAPAGRRTGQDEAAVGRDRQLPAAGGRTDREAVPG